MAKLSEIFANVLKLDPNKDYDVQVSETQATPKPELNPVPAPPVPAALIETPTVTNPPISTVENQSDNTAKLQERITALEAANLALLQRLPIQENEKSTEELIYDLCVQTQKGVTNGTNQT